MAYLTLWATLATAVAAQATGSIADIEHVVLFMQENRAFDHYFGTMAGVRGFQDPNVQVNDGTAVWFQKVEKHISKKADELLPWYLNYLHGAWDAATQCMHPGGISYSANHEALNGDRNDQWVNKQTPWSWGHFTRAELPAHFAIAEGWTVGDMYQESVIASTSPNRVAWLSGSINVPGGPQDPSEGGTYLDNNRTPGCEDDNLNCYPLKWTTAPEHWQNANVSWQVYQDNDNFDDNPLPWFEQFQNASSSSELAKRGMKHIGLKKFYEDAAKGTLPQVSIIVGPAELSEHAPHTPQDGGWFQSMVVNAVTSSPNYNKTALIISYDETGGWGDHVTPYHSPEGTAGEWIDDPYLNMGNTYTGPGFRVPFYIVSPWTRGGHVYVEHTDHSSQIMFIEKWLAAKGFNVETQEIPSWRRTNMADLTNAFDFSNPDYTLPNIPNITYPSTDSKGDWNGPTVCSDKNVETRPPPPFGEQNQASALDTESGFKLVRGQLTEGRYLVFESGGQALTSKNGVISSTKATARHDTKSQRFVVKQQTPGGQVFDLFDMDGTTIGNYTIADLGNGKGYTLQKADGSYLSIGSSNAYTVYSVTYGEGIFLDREDSGAVSLVKTAMKTKGFVAFAFIQLWMVFYL